MRTPRGRCLSSAGWDYLGLTPPAAVVRQLDLLGTIDDPAEPDIGDA
jgi:Holliday junction DNA helicase RuvB